MQQSGQGVSSFTAACNGGLARRSSSSTISLPLSSFARFFLAMDSVTHSPSMTLFVSSTSAKSGRRGDRGSNHGCSRSALNVGRFRGTLFKLPVNIIHDVKGGNREGDGTIAKRIPAQLP